MAKRSSKKTWYAKYVYRDREDESSRELVTTLIHAKTREEAVEVAKARKLAAANFAHNRDYLEPPDSPHDIDETEIEVTVLDQKQFDEKLKKEAQEIDEIVEEIAELDADEVEAEKASRKVGC